MNRYWSELTRRLTPYVPGEQRTGKNILKLNTNENPYPPSPAVLDAIASVGGDELKRYPDPEAAALCQVLADYHSLTTDQVFVGNGSDEILALAFMAFFTGEKPLQFPAISYSFYPVYCDLLDITAHTVSLEADFSLSPERFKFNAGGIVFPNPNAPTGMALSRQSIAEVLSRHTDNVLLVDEAYADLGADSVVGLVNDYPNLLVSHTFSKGRSMAGMRVGAAFGDAGLIEAMRRVKDSFNSYPVDAVAQRAAVAAVKDDVYYRDVLAKIIATRQRSAAALEQRGFQVLPSSANFIFASPPNAIGANELYNALSASGVLVRYWPKPPIGDWLRISIGTNNDMDRLFAEVDKVIAAA